MKNTLLLFSACILIFSCKKSSTSSNTNTPTTTSYLSSIRTLAPLTQVIDSLVYDTAHHVAKFIQYEYDSTNASPISDSITVVFSFAPNATTPNAYSYIEPGYVNETHNLYYDGNNRIIKDTCISGSGFVTYFTYPGNNIASTVLFDGTIDNNQIDTLFTSNGNVTAEKVYYPGNQGSPDTLSGAIQLSFSGYANPAYNSKVATSIGPLLYILTYDGFGGYTDYISKNIVGSLNGVGEGLPGFPINFNWATDADGNVINGHVSLSSASEAINFYYY